MNEQAFKRPDYTLLTIARFFCALWVVVYHIVVVIQADGKGGAGILDNPISKLGFMGVPFFFALSGFILGKLYQNPQLNRKDFYIKRFVRIYPSYFVILSILVLISAIDFPRTLSYCAPVSSCFTRGYRKPHKTSCRQRGR
jgi:peptidoglycan/LPS O-acetylase OafA/YrhL